MNMAGQPELIAPLTFAEDLATIAASGGVQWLIDQIESARAAYAEIERNRDMSEEGKAKAIEKTRQARIEKLMTELHSRAEVDRRGFERDRRAALGNDGLSGDPATLVILRRDSDDRVRGTRAQPAAEIEELLSQAIAADDKLLVRAIGREALALDNLDLYRQFIASDPSTAKAAQRVWVHHRAQVDFGSQEDSALGVLTLLDRRSFSSPNETIALGYLESFGESASRMVA
jgi:hypothetical protein